MGEGKPAGRQPNILKPLLYETLVYSTPTPTSAPTLFVSWCIYVIHSINCSVRNKTLSCWYSLFNPLHVIFLKTHALRCKRFIECHWNCFPSFQVQTWPSVSRDIFLTSVWGYIYNHSFLSFLFLTHLHLVSPTTILHVLPLCVTLVWSVPDCWLSAHLPKQDPNPMTSLEAQITLTSLPEWHTDTTHYRRSYSIEKLYTHFTYQREERWKIGVSNKRPATEKCHGRQRAEHSR